jgi:predicted HAD superfamily phosphohydrolase YqeG
MFHHAKIPDEKNIEHMKVNLSRAKGYEDKKTIIFDLDETLIHCN